MVIENEFKSLADFIPSDEEADSPRRGMKARTCNG